MIRPSHHASQGSCAGLSRDQNRLITWALDGLRLSRKQLRAVFRDDHDIFEPHTEFAGDVNSRLIAEGHSRFELRLIAAHQIRLLVAIHADAVTDAMREIFIAGAEACIDDHLARRCVHIFASRAGPRCLERRRLRPVFDVPQFALPNTVVRVMSDL